MFKKNFILILLCTAFLAACSTFPAFKKENPVVEPQPVTQITLPMPGEEVFIKDATTGIESAVRIENVYQAASGRTCTYYSRSGNSPRPDGFACLVNDQWTQLPMIINPDKPENLQ